MRLQSEQLENAFVNTDMFFGRYGIFQRLLAACGLNVGALQRGGPPLLLQRLFDTRILAALCRSEERWSMDVAEFSHLFAYLSALISLHRFVSKLYCISNIMLFSKLSLSLCYFVQPFLRLLSTITVCSTNPAERRMQYFKDLPLTVLESQACTQNLSEASIHNLK